MACPCKNGTTKQPSGHPGRSDQGTMRPPNAPRPTVSRDGPYPSRPNGNDGRRNRP